MDVIERLAQHSHGAAQKLNVRSALNPMLWICAVSATTCFTFAYLLRDFSFARTFLLIVGMLPIAVTCFGFCYLAVKKPEKLQSEDFQIRQQTLQIIQHKTGRLNVDAADLEAIANLTSKQIKSGKGTL